MSFGGAPAAVHVVSRMELGALPHELSRRPSSHRGTGPDRDLSRRRQQVRPPAARAENEGLEPWNVPEIWLINGREPNHYVDITEMFDRKVTALRAHASQTAHQDRLVDRLRADRVEHDRSWTARGAAGRAFQVIMNG